MEQHKLTCSEHYANNTETHAPISHTIRTLWTDSSSRRFLIEIHLAICYQEQGSRSSQDPNTNNTWGVSHHIPRRINENTQVWYNYDNNIIITII